MSEEERRELTRLVRQMKKDPNVSFGRFYDLTKKRTFYLILSYVRRSEVAEDLLQETYVSFLGSLDKVSVRLNPLSYLMTSARNKAIDYLRKEHQVATVDEETLDSLGSSDFVYEDSTGLLRRIASLLTPLEFRTYALHVLGEMTFKEIGKLLHRPVGTLTYTYQMAIAKLQKGLTEDGERRI